VSKRITTPAATTLLNSLIPAGGVAGARHELTLAQLADLRRIDDQLRWARATITAAVRAGGTSLTGIFGVGPVIAATIIGDAGEISRLPGADRFAAYNGTAPIEVSSGNRKACRLSRRGNRRMNHAIYMAAVTQIRYSHSDGRAYYDRKIKEGKTRSKRSAPSNGASATPSTGTCSPTPDTPATPSRLRAREDNRGTALNPARPAHTRTPALRTRSRSSGHTS
jgi:transposase